MIERSDKRYVSCPVCGRFLLRGSGKCDIEIICNKCNRKIAVIIEMERVIVFENERETEKDGRVVQARVINIAKS